VRAGHGPLVSHPFDISSRVGGTGPGTPLPPAIRWRIPWLRGRHRSATVTAVPAAALAVPNVRSAGGEWCRRPGVRVAERRSGPLAPLGRAPQPQHAGRGQPLAVVSGLPDL